MNPAGILVHENVVRCGNGSQWPMHRFGFTLDEVDTPHFDFFQTFLRFFAFNNSRGQEDQ